MAASKIAYLKHQSGRDKVDAYDINKVQDNSEAALRKHDTDIRNDLQNGLTHVTRLVIKDDAVPPHYWALTTDSAGILTTTDLGTSPP